MISWQGGGEGKGGRGLVTLYCRVRDKKGKKNKGERYRGGNRRDAAAVCPCFGREGRKGRKGRKKHT